MDTYYFDQPHSGRTLAQLLRQAGADQPLPCGGHQRCGKCKVVATGRMQPPTAAELERLTPAEVTAGYRLACFARAAGPVEVRLPAARQQQILAGSTAVSGTLDPLMGPGEYGAAIDIGTTTVVCYLFRGDSPAPLGHVCAPNRQQVFGADVIARIHHGIQSGHQQLHRLLVQQVDTMLDALCARQKVSRHRLTAAVVTGNTTMLHFFSGLDPRGIGSLPFAAASLFDCWDSRAIPGLNCYLPPCISSYAGADLVCAILHSGLWERGETALIVDIGTNGEMALIHQGKLYSCSTAAGPAFEGAGISQGMPAETGAISFLDREEDGSFVCRTIGDAPARGLCGSGLLDAVALLWREGALSDQGLLLSRGHALEDFVVETERETFFCLPESQVRLTQADIRQVQMAKAAIHGGIQTLLSQLEIGVEQLQAFYLCGGFGSYLRVESAEQIGLVPEGVKPIATVLGNGAAAGAARALMQRSQIETMRQIRAGCSYLELSENAEFMDAYIGSMAFAME